MANIFKAKTILGRTGIFSHELIAPNFIYNTGNQIISGNKTFVNNIEVQGTGIFNSVDLSNISEFSFSGVTINLRDSAVQASGQIYISGNPVLTGIDLSSYATISNLASTGSILNNKINSLSGYINSSNSNIVFTTGNQNIGGDKTFTGTTTFSGQEVNLVDTSLNLSGVGDMTLTSTNINFINSPVFISGTNLRVSGDIYGYNIFVSGNPVLTGVDLSNYVTKSLAIAYAIAL